MFTTGDVYIAESIAFGLGCVVTVVPCLILLARSKRHSAWQDSQIATLLENPKRDSRGRFVK